jgi:hypothetical protein
VGIRIQSLFLSTEFHSSLFLIAFPILRCFLLCSFRRGSNYSRFSLFALLDSQLLLTTHSSSLSDYMNDQLHLSYLLFFIVTLCSRSALGKPSASRIRFSKRLQLFFTLPIDFKFHQWNITLAPIDLRRHSPRRRAGEDPSAVGSSSIQTSLPLSHSLSAVVDSHCLIKNMTPRLSSLWYSVGSSLVTRDN